MEPNIIIFIIILISTAIYTYYQLKYENQKTQTTKWKNKWKASQWQLEELLDIKAQRNKLHQRAQKAEAQRDKAYRTILLNYMRQWKRIPDEYFQHMHTGINDYRKTIPQTKDPITQTLYNTFINPDEKPNNG